MRNAQRPKDTCLTEIELCAQIFVLSNYSKFNYQHKYGDLRDHLRRKRIFTSIMNKKSI